jgi:hypothetical protein
MAEGFPRCSPRHRLGCAATPAALDGLLTWPPLANRRSIRGPRPPMSAALILVLGDPTDGTTLTGSTTLDAGTGTPLLPSVSARGTVLVHMPLRCPSHVKHSVHMRECPGA